MVDCDVLDHCRVDDLVAMDDDVSKSHHTVERGRQLFGKPVVANQQLEELAVRARLAQALTRNNVRRDVQRCLNSDLKRVGSNRNSRTSVRISAGRPKDFNSCTQVSITTSFLRTRSVSIMGVRHSAHDRAEGMARGPRTHSAKKPRTRCGVEGLDRPTARRRAAPSRSSPPEPGLD